MEYQLYDNHFTPDDPEDRIARTTNVKVNTREDLVRDMSGPGEILKPTEINAVIDRMWGQLITYVSQGEAYQDEYMTFRFDISGVFRNDDDQFDRNRHSLLLTVILKAIVTSVTSLIKMRKVGTTQPVRPEVDSVYDWGSDTTNKQLTPGDILEISGDDLKVHDNLETEGIWFQNRVSLEEAKAQQGRTNESKTLTIRIPELDPGTYWLLIRNTRYDSKKLREGMFVEDLVVV